MSPPPSSSAPAPSQVLATGEWLIGVGLAATLVWTTLGLGGYLAETMVVTAWAVFGLAALGGLLWLAAPGDGASNFNRAALLPVPFLLYALASVLWLAPARWLAWREWLLWLQMWLVFALVLHFGRGRRATWLVGTLAALGLAGAGMAGYQRFGNPAWLMLGRTQAPQFYERSSGMFGIPNSFAGLLELMIPVCLTLLFSRATKAGPKILGGGLAAVFLFAIVLTGSRGGWIGLGLALILWPLLGGRVWRKRLVGTALILLLAVAGAWMLYRFSPSAHERIQPFLEGRFEASRPLIWKAGWQIWRDHPWLGSGAASYNVLFDQHRPRGFLNEPNWTHNDYLNTLSDYGMAGFALWLAAGGGLLWLGWQAGQRVRHESPPAPGLLSLGEWRSGLLVGLLAFAFHLGVDFHTKMPALALAAATVAALLLRDEPCLSRPVGTGWARGLGGAVMLGSLLVAGWVAAPLYRAESLRYESRRAIDRLAAGEGDPRQVIPAAREAFARAVRIDPTNGQAWADLSYATVQTWSVTGGDLVAIGREAGSAADRAVALCPLNAEFWVRQGVALDMQARHEEGEQSFRRALNLAPNFPAWWYYYAYHLSVFPGRKTEALQSLETCLALDPSNSGAVNLRQQLVVRH